MPEDVSVPHDVYLFSILNETDNILTSNIYLPIHVRYHSPQPGGGFQSAILSPPEIYVICTQFPMNYSTGSQFPCFHDSTQLCEYHQLPYEIVSNIFRFFNANFVYVCIIWAKVYFSRSL